MKKKTSAASKVILTLTLLFFYLPILYIIVFSFNDSRSLTKFGGFSLRWYEKMFADSTMMEAVLYTVVIALLATVESTIGGTGTNGYDVYYFEIPYDLDQGNYTIVMKLYEHVNDVAATETITVRSAV